MMKGEANGVHSPLSTTGMTFGPRWRDNLLAMLASPCGRFPGGGADFRSVRAGATFKPHHFNRLPQGYMPQRRKGETEVPAPHLLPLVDMLLYNLKDPIKRITYLLVGKPNDANPMGFEELLPLTIVRCP